MKKLLAGGIIRDLLFDSQDSFDIYIYKLQHDKQQYKILDVFTRDDGSVIVRILGSYNASPLIRGLD